MWQKQGLVYVAAGEQSWAQSHAALPTSLMLDSDRIRVYVAFLDRDRVGRIGFVDVAARNPLQVLRVSDQPAFDIGVPGAFDEQGVTPLSITRHQGKIFLFYNGWQLGKRVRYYLFAGLAVSEDGGELFRRISQAPILDRSDGELFVRSAVHVMRDEERWKMWYIAGDKWIDVHGKQLPSYNMRYLESDDLSVWGRKGRVVLDLANSDEFGFGRPFILKEDGLYKMWYSIRTLSKGYRLGYAESSDGLSWNRKDEEVGIEVSATGWDSEMISFPRIQQTEYGTYMFHNGNNYGETGFGVATLER
jgi:hypothetical protein